MIQDCTLHFPQFVDYYRRNPAGGSLHIVLEDFNLDDESVSFCKQYATENLDFEGIRLADLLCDMSKTQRGKIARAVHQ